MSEEKITLGDIKEAEGVFAVLNNSKMPIKLSYRLSKILSKIISELKHFQELHVTLVKKYGTKEEKSENYKVNDDKLEEFSKEYSELLDTVSTEEIEPIPFSLLLDTDAKLSPSQISTIKKFIKEDEEKK